jgi:hypothetical protein
MHDACPRAKSWAIIPISCGYEFLPAPDAVVAADIRLGLGLAKQNSASMMPINKTTTHGSVV